MGRRCQICANTQINIINRALLGGATLSETARRYGLALGSLHRHRSKCLGLPTSQAVIAAPSRLAGIEATLPTREEVAGGFASIRSQLDGIVADAKAARTRRRIRVPFVRTQILAPLEISVGVCE